MDVKTPIRSPSGAGAASNAEATVPKLSVRMTGEVAVREIAQLKQAIRDTAVSGIAMQDFRLLCLQARQMRPTAS